MWRKWRRTNWWCSIPLYNKIVLLASLLLLCGLWPSPSHAAAIRHASTEFTTNITTTSTTYVAATGGSVTAAQLTAAGISVGDTVAIIITGQITGTSAAWFVRYLHGATAFDGLVNHDMGTQGAFGRRKTFSYFTTWDVVASEDIIVNWKVGAGEGGMDQLSIVVLDLEDLASTDWAANDHATDDTLTTTPLAGATVTFTPTAASNWVVMAWSQIQHETSTESGVSRLVRSGEASSSLPESRFESPIFTVESAHATMRVFSLGTASNTFTEESFENVDPTPTFNRLHSKVFALNLSAFRNHAFAYTEAGLAITGTTIGSPTEIQTIGLTPAVVSNVWVLAGWGFDRNSSTVEAMFRVQVDGTDAPLTQTSDNYQFENSSADDTDENWVSLSTMVASMSAAAHTIDLDAAVDNTTNTPAAQYRSLLAVTMELPAVAGDARAGLLMRGVGN